MFCQPWCRSGLCGKTPANRFEVTLYVEKMQQHSLDLIGLARDRLGVPVQGKSFDETGFEEYASQSKKSYPVVSLLPLALPRLVERRCLFIDVDTLGYGGHLGTAVSRFEWDAYRSLCGYGPNALGGQDLRGESIGSDSSFTCLDSREKPTSTESETLALFQVRIISTAVS